MEQQIPHVGSTRSRWSAHLGPSGPWAFLTAVAQQIRQASQMAAERLEGDLAPVWALLHGLKERWGTFQAEAHHTHFVSILVLRGQSCIRFLPCFSKKTISGSHGH